MSLKIGCQTYPWKMAGTYAGEIPHILETASASGFSGLEAEIGMLGTYYDRPEKLKKLLDERQMSLAALVLHQDWEGTCQSNEEQERSSRAVAFLKHFPFAKLMMSHHAGDQPRGEGEALARRRRNLVACMQEVAVRAAEEGIVSCFHPNSASNSLFVNGEDYDVLFELLPSTAIGWAPDVGHLVKGGIDALGMMKNHRDLIRHVHFKDHGPRGEWTLMGKGTVNYPAIMRFLKETGYSGWIMVEDESETAAADPDEIVRLDGRYMRSLADSI